MNREAKIYVAGHKGMVGSAIKRRLEADGYGNLVFRSHTELDLTRQAEVEDFFSSEKPEYVFLSAAKVGGIMANSTFPAEFIYENIMISTNIIHSSYKAGVKKLLNLGSSCIYPKNAPQPLKEEYLLTNTLEPTNEAYAIAKIAAIKLCRFYNEQFGTDYLSVMPTNLYGPGDNFDLEKSHVLPALIRRFHEAKEGNMPYVTLWGTGTPLREFLYVEDLADACVHVMQNFHAKEIGEFVNIGAGRDLPIKDLAELVAGIVGYEGEIRWDSTKPDGMAKKLLDVSRINGMGWKACTTLSQGIKQTYDWYKTVSYKWGMDGSGSRNAG
ncbi:MAG TPA: GDP-L-fucose synthase [Deltaproteobacteria bacterium]|nr:GDP-L-fucose synthase [Deltaproteobacteria bacterium]